MVCYILQYYLYNLYLHRTIAAYGFISYSVRGSMKLGSLSKMAATVYHHYIYYIAGAETGIQFALSQLLQYHSNIASQCVRFASIAKYVNSTCSTVCHDYKHEGSTATHVRAAQLHA